MTSIVGLTQTRSEARVRDLGEVFTAEREVDAMLDLLPADVWTDASKTFLEPACGNGNFLVAILGRKLDAIDQSGDDSFDKACNIIEAVESIYGVDIMSDNIAEAQARLYRIVMDRLPDLIPIKSFNIFQYVGGEVLKQVDQALNRNIIVGDFLKDFDAIKARWNDEVAV